MTFTRRHSPPPQDKPRFGLRSLFAVLMVFLLAVGATAASPSSAQEDDELESEKLEEIREEQERNKAAREATARGINGTAAEIEELTNAMDVLNQAINEQVVRMDFASTKLFIAEQRFNEATNAAEAAQELLLELEEQVKVRAVESFLGQDISTPDVVYTSNPGLTVRMEAMLAAVLQGDVDVADAYVAVQNDLAVQREVARINRVAAEEFRLEVETVQRRLEQDREIQEALFVATEERLEHLLNEQSYLQTKESELSEQYKAETRRLQAALQASRYTGAGGSAGPVATPDEISWVYGIAIHNSIAPQLQALIEAAQADGITLTGGGWRDPAAQIRLRRAHCGTSDYAVWEAPASSCRPPTARPGSSLHERGLAVDFSENHRSINSPNSRAFLWLKANAAQYGFYNLPSERWHWSTTGK